MANHAQVRTGKKLNPEEVNTIVQRLNQENLGGVFTVKFETNLKPGSGWGKHQWFVQYKDDEYITMIFWLTDEEEHGFEKEGEYIEYDEPKILSKQSCIEFRHGHSFDFMWWVEGVFRENLGKHYNARMWDDGVGECEPANPERYVSYKQYLSWHDAKDLKLIKKMRFDWQKDDIPKELIEVLDLDFQI